MPKAGRIRVLIAGNVYVKRALVRRFLEDDGYAVVGDVMSADAVIPAVRAGQPDAVVLDEDLAFQGAGIAAIRGAAADVRVIVFTAAATGAGAPPPGADGYLDKGVGLSALTALLGRFFFEPTGPLEPLLVGAGAGMAASEPPQAAVGGTDAGPKRARGTTAGNLSRMVAMAAGVLLVVWGIAAAIERNGVRGDTTTIAEPSPSPTGVEVVEPGSPSLLDEAYATLDRLVGALGSGNYIVGTVEAQALAAQRDEAVTAGYALAGFDAEVTSRLETIAATLPQRVNTQLAATLGSLYPPFEAPTEPGQGTDGTTTSGDGGTSTDTNTGGTETTGGDGGGEGGGALEDAPQPGDGKSWGLSHKPPHGGWHGTKPHKK